MRKRGRGRWTGRGSEEGEREKKAEKGAVGRKLNQGAEFPSH